MQVIDKPSKGLLLDQNKVKAFYQRSKFLQPNPATGDAGNMACVYPSIQYNL